MSLAIAGISSSIGSSFNSVALRLDPRSLLLVVTVLLLEESPLGGVGDYEAGTDAVGEGRRG